MNFEMIAASRLVQDLGWTLLDSLWQIAAISLVLYAVLALFRNASPNFRYLLSISALSLSLLIPAVTFLARTQTKSEAASANSASNLKLEQVERDALADRGSVAAGKATQ